MASTTQIANNAWLHASFPQFPLPGIIPNDNWCPRYDVIVNIYRLGVTAHYPRTNYAGNQLVVQEDIGLGGSYVFFAPFTVFLTDMDTGTDWYPRAELMIAKDTGSYELPSAENIFYETLLSTGNQLPDAQNHARGEYIWYGGDIYIPYGYKLYVAALGETSYLDLYSSPNIYSRIGTIVDHTAYNHNLWVSNQ